MLPIPVTTIIPTTPQSIITNCQAKKDTKLLGDSNMGVPQLSMKLAASEIRIELVQLWETSDRLDDPKTSFSTIALECRCDHMSIESSRAPGCKDMSAVQQDAKKVHVAPRGLQDSSSSDCLHLKASDKFQLRIPTITAQDRRSFDAMIPCLSNSELQKPGNNRLPGHPDHIWCPLAAGIVHHLLLNPNRSSVTPRWKDESDQ